MAELSSAESVLRKITELGGQIDAFYETADTARQIKDRLAAAHRISLDYEKQFGIRTAEMEKLKNGFAEALARMTELAERSDTELLHILSTLGYEHAHILETMKDMAGERADLCRQQKQLQRAVGDSIQEINAAAAFFSQKQQNSLAENRLRLAEFLDECRQLLAEESRQIRQAWEPALEEIFYLGDRTDQLRADTEFQLRKKTDSFAVLQTLYRNAVQCIAEIGQKYETERAGLLEEIRHQNNALRHSLAELAASRQMYREEHLFLAQEKAAVLKELHAHSAWLSKETGAFQQQLRLRTAAHLDENRKEFQEEKERLVLFQSDMGEEFRYLEEGLEDFEKRTKFRINRRIKKFDALGPEYENIIRQLLWLASRFDRDRLEMLTDFALEKDNFRQFRKALGGEHLEMRKLHRHLQGETREFFSNLTTRMTYFSESAQQLIRDIRIQAAQHLDENRRFLHREWENLNGFSRQTAEEIRHLEDELENFKKRKAFEISHMARALAGHTDQFRKNMQRAIRRDFQKEQQHFQARAREEFRRFTRAFAEEKKGMDNALVFLDAEKKEIKRHLSLILQIWQQWGDFRRQAEDSVFRMENMLQKSDREFLEILTVFAYREARLRKTEEELEKGKTEIRNFQHHLDKKAEEIRREVTEHAIRSAEDLRRNFQEISFRNKQELYENRQIMQEEKENLSLFSEGLQEEIRHLGDELEQFKRESLDHIHQRYRELGRQHGQYRQSLTEEIRSSFSKESERIRNRAEAGQKENIRMLEQERKRVDDALAFLESARESFSRHREQIRRICEKSDAFEIQNRRALDRLTQIGDRAEDELLRIVTEFMREKNGIRQVLDTFAHERSELRSYHRNLESEVLATGKKMAEEILRFREEGEAFMQNTGLQAAQRADEYRTELRRDTAAFHLSLRETQEEMMRLAEEMQDMQHRTQAESGKKIREFCKQQENFSTRLRENTESALFRAKEKTEQFIADEAEKIREALTALSSEKAEIRKAQEQTLRQMESLDREMKNSAASFRNESEKQIADLSEKQDRGRKEILKIREYLHSSAQQIKEKMMQDKENQKEQQADFRKKILSALGRKLAQETGRLQAQDERNAQQARERTEELEKSLREEFKKMENRMSDRFRESRSENEKQFFQFGDLLKEREVRQGKALSDIAERVRHLEEELAFMKQKKGLAALFAKEKGKQKNKEEQKGEK